MATTIKTLRDLGIDRLYDAPTGQIIPDDPADYVVLDHEDEGQREYIMARGPSGDMDILVRDITGSRLYRDVACDSINQFKSTY